MKILILTTDVNQNIDSDPRFLKLSTGELFLHLKKNHDTQMTVLDQLSIEITSEGNKITYKGTDLRLYDRIVIRAVVDLDLDFEWIAQLVSDYALQHGIKTLNARHFARFGCGWNKLRQTLLFSQYNLPVPDTFFSNSEGLTFPLLAKPLTGSHGRGIHLVNSVEQAQNESEYIFQELLPNRQDYRVIVLGGKVLGAMLRRANGDTLVSNISAGGEAIFCEVDPEIEKLALQLAKICELDMCGVDLMKDSQGKYRVLEVNRKPEYGGFQIATKMNVSAEIEKYLVQL